MNKDIIREYRKINHDILELIDVASQTSDLEEFKAIHRTIKSKQAKRKVIIEQINSMRAVN